MEIHRERLEMIGKQIRYLRKSRVLTQTRLAELTELSITHISKIERGEVNFSLAVLFTIYDALDVPIDLKLTK